MAQKTCNITESRYGIPEWNMAIRDFVALRVPHPDATARVAGVPFSLLGGFGTGRYNPRGALRFAFDAGHVACSKTHRRRSDHAQNVFPHPWP